MTSPYRPLDLSGIKRVRLAQRKSKVHEDLCGKPWKAGGNLGEFLDSLPRLLASQSLREVTAALARSRRKGKVLLWGMGAHVIKAGLSPILIDLMDRGWITGLATHGAGSIHDLEMALVGHTSEEVGEALREGTFGMAEETAQIIASALQEGLAQGWGYGKALGMKLLKLKPPHLDKSLLAAAAQREIPVTVHVAIGTDIIHMHPSCSGEALGAASHQDFRLFAAMVCDLQGGAYLNLGSAVILPEVFLKALALARNLGHELDSFTTLNMDFLPHYRPEQNVIRRPALLGARTFSLLGHHEIMIPLLAAALIEETNP
jgi:deoxyhypusine synthase